MEAKPHARMLEITVICGEKISVDQSSATENACVVVRAESLDCYKTKMVNGDGGVHAWNEKFLLNVPSHARSVTFEVQSKKYKGFRPIGVARIALSDFLSGNNNVVSENEPQMLCYWLRSWEGRRNGVIRFSVKEVMTKAEDDLCSETKKKEYMTRVSSSCGMEHGVVGSHVDHKKSNRVVIGIPVWWELPKCCCLNSCSIFR